TRAATGDRMERRRWLGNCLAATAHELLTHRLDHLPLARHALQGLGNGLAQFGWSPPQQGHAVRPGMTTRSRGRCAGSGPRTGLRRVKVVTTLPAWSALASMARTPDGGTIIGAALSSRVAASPGRHH